MACPHCDSTVLTRCGKVEHVTLHDVCVCGVEVAVLYVYRLAVCVDADVGVAVRHKPLVWLLWLCTRSLKPQFGYNKVESTPVSQHGAASTRGACRLPTRHCGDGVCGSEQKKVGQMMTKLLCGASMSTTHCGPVYPGAAVDPTSAANSFKSTI